jgi:hypothetical protein
MLGGFESILKKMTFSNFNWFLHAMPFHHIRIVIDKTAKKTSDAEEKVEDDAEDKGDC